MNIDLRFWNATAKLGEAFLRGTARVVLNMEKHRISAALRQINKR
jgi:hypothetical protein